MLDLTSTPDLGPGNAQAPWVAVPRELLDEVDAAVIVRGADWKVSYWNRGAERLYGYTSAHALGRDLRDLIVPELTLAALGALNREAVAGRPAAGVIELHDQAGRCFPVRVGLRALDGEGDQQPSAVIGFAVGPGSQPRPALSSVSVGHAEIAQLSWLARRGAPLEALFDRAARKAASVLSADCASLIGFRPDEGFVVEAVVGWPGRAPQVPSDEALRYVLRSQRPLVVEDWEHERRVSLPDHMRARGIRATVDVLIGDPESPAGLLSVHYTTPQRSLREHVPFLDALGNVLAEAIDSGHVRETVRRQSLHDTLTGLPNRALLLDHLQHELEFEDHRGKRPAVMVIDLDHFVIVNDSLGHQSGDELLRLVTARLERLMRKGDMFARLGADEFAVLCRDLRSEVTVVRIADRVLGALEEPFTLQTEERVLSASIGIAVSNRTSSAEELLRDADAAMNHAKHRGRGRAELFDKEMRARVLGRVRTESALRAALARDEEISVQYQPLVSLRSGEIVGAEALARWRHPDWGPVAPLEFVPVAEDSGLIHALGAHIMHLAAREARAWQDVAGFRGIAINVSARQLVQPGEVAELARRVVLAQGIRPGFLTLELTESLLIEELDSARDALGSLTALGVRLALDDFGTGYSSLSYLRDLRFDCVKIDQSLIRNIVDAPRDAAVIDAIIHLAHALDLEVVAEGLETDEQVAGLQALGCDLGQGHRFAPPLAAAEFDALLREPPADWLPRLKWRTGSKSAGTRVP